MDDGEALIVRRIFGSYLDGDGYAAIAQRLNELRVPAPRIARRAGGGWMHSYPRNAGHLLESPQRPRAANARGNSGAIGQALATPKAIAYVRQRFAERVGALSRNASQELSERSARLERTEERIRESF